MLWAKKGSVASFFIPITHSGLLGNAKLLVVIAKINATELWIAALSSQAYD